MNGSLQFAIKAIQDEATSPLWARIAALESELTEARKTTSLAREQMREECIAACDEVCECPTIEKNIQALQGVEDCINAIRALGAKP